SFGVKQKGKKNRTTIASADYSIGTGKRITVRMPPTKTGRKIVKEMTSGKHRKSPAFNGGGLKMKRLLLLLVAVGVLGAAFMASTANAAVGIQKWESLTCKSNEDLPEITEFEDFKKIAETPEVGYEPLAEPAGHCEGGNAESLFTQAGGHPNYGITDFKIDT